MTAAKNILPDPNTASDIWTGLEHETRPIVIYGMGDGADKILYQCSRRHIEISDFFASDDHVRGQSFHGKPVLRLQDVESRYGSDCLILIAFASSLPNVLEQIRDLRAKHAVLVPDTPVFGNTFFTKEFYREHFERLSQVMDWLSDDPSRDLFTKLIRYKLSGDYASLDGTESCANQILDKVLNMKDYRVALDLGAYTGDSVAEWLDHAPELKTVFAFEPDVHSQKKLSAYAESISDRVELHVEPYAVWSESGTLEFDANTRGNRNACVMDHYGDAVRDRKKKSRTVEAVSLDDWMTKNRLPSRVDLIKMDVEGSEKEVLKGCTKLFRTYAPDMQISLYHRPEDLFELPEAVHRSFPDAKMLIRRTPYVPAWDVNLFVIQNRT